jgi:hypothetical protein
MVTSLSCVNKSNRWLKRPTTESTVYF